MVTGPFSSRFESIKSITVPLLDTLQEWPHAGPLQSGLARTIAGLCGSILRFSWAGLWTLTADWVTSFPALLRVYGVLVLNYLWYHGPCVLRVALFEKTSRMGWKEPTTTTSLIQETPPLPPSSEEFSPPFSSPLWSVGQVPADDTTTAHWADITNKMTQGGGGTVFSK